jgi:cyanophycinase
VRPEFAGRPELEHPEARKPAFNVRVTPKVRNGAGMLALVGGDEFNPGNEEQDRMLAAAARSGPAFVVPTAAARQGPEVAVDHAKRWFKQFGLALEELPVLKRGDAESAVLADRAREGGFFYLVGGDPGFVAQVLRGSAVWRAIFEAWHEGAALAGSSAGAMALCSQTLVRASWPKRFDRRPIAALGVVPKTAVLPHFDTFGQRWVESAREAAPGVTLLGIDERSAASWQADEWRAAGPGSVTVIKGAKVIRFASGEKVTGLPSPVRMLPRYG